MNAKLWSFIGRSNHPFMKFVKGKSKWTNTKAYGFNNLFGFEF